MRSHLRRLAGTVAATAAVSCVPVLMSLSPPALAQGGASSVYVQDMTTPANGGTGRAQGVADRMQQALTDANSCVETSDNQDVKDAIADERDRSLQEGGDPSARLQEIGKMVGADILIGIQALPAPGGGTQYSAFAMDAKSARTIARAMGSEDQVVKSMVSQLGGAFATSCKPHWVGTVTFAGSSVETKTTKDGGPMHAARRKVSRTRTVSLDVNSTMTAHLLPPSPATKTLNSPMARVAHSVTSVSRTEQTVSGEERCRTPGRNPTWEGFSESYSETVTMKGRATGTSPVFILIDSDGRYSIRVTVPGGESIGSIAVDKSPSQACGAKGERDKDLQSAPPGTFDASGFDAEGKVDPARKDTLAGSSSSPDGKTRMNWNLRLVKPKGP